MELREFAEQILFARTLGEKLADPGEITDTRPGTALQAPTAPGRPAELGFKPRDTGEPGSPFPGTRHLDRRDERGRVLHFFANHELLAVELMALALLRFPDAPAAFRRGLLKTLRDEQEHTRWYVRRMEQCGIRFGELPVSGHLWRLLSRMESPLDYVAGLPLTFEQANLDFSREYGRAFAEAGDTETADLLGRIHRDEIVHVGFGLKWFRRWKDPSLDDWQAFERQLHFPLSPSRAKGRQVDVEGRHAAGLDAAFISELRVYGRSRGRAPVVHWFNPAAEDAIASGPGFQPSSAQQALVADLALLPMFLAAAEDVVLVPQKPGSAFLAGLQDAGFPVPEFETLAGSPPVLDPLGVASRPVSGLSPWAWSPDSVALLAPLARRLPSGGHPGLAEGSPDRHHPYRKSWSARFLGEWLADGTREPWICPPDCVGHAVSNTAELDAAIDRIRRTGHHRIVVKADLGLAGAGMLRLWEPTILPSQRRWMEARLDSGHCLVVEPWLERVADFSVQFHHEQGRMRLLGFTGLENDLRGQFRSNWAEPRFDRRPPASVIRAFGNCLAGSDAGGRIHAVFDSIADRLASRLDDVGHHGPLGIDAFVFLDSHGAPRLKPVVEINPRHTMGRLTLSLMRHVAPGRRARFRLVGQRDLREAGDPDFASYAGRLRAAHPWTRAGEPVARLTSGSVCLSDPSRATSCLAVLQVESLD